MRPILLLLLIYTAPLFSQPAKPVTILTINSYAFPKNRSDFVSLFFLDLHPKTELPVDKRLQLLAEAIMELPEPKPDIIAVQEAWGTRNKRRLINHLSDHYPHFAYDQQTWNGRWVFGMNSGLLILSKLPIVRDESICYTVGGVHEEIFAYKGALLAEFKDSDGRSFVVANTHLQSESSLEAEQVRLLQVDELGQALNHFANDESPLIICGDFNSELIFDPNEGVWNRQKLNYITETLARSEINVSTEPVIDLLPLRILGSYWENKAIIDHFFLSPGIEVSHYHIHREFVGSSPKSPNNASTAITDHAGIILQTNILYSN